MKLTKYFIKLISSLALKLIGLYQAIPLAHKCRFHPSCSEYAKMKIQQDGIKAIGKITIRVLKCNPFAKRRVYMD